MHTRLQGSLQTALEGPDHKKQGYNRRTRHHNVIRAREYKVDMQICFSARVTMQVCSSARGTVRTVRPRLPARLTDRGAGWFPLHEPSLVCPI